MIWNSRCFVPSARKVGSIPDTAIDYLTVAVFGAQLLLERYARLLATRYEFKETPDSPTALLTEIGTRRGGLRPGGASTCTRRPRS